MMKMCRRYRGRHPAQKNQNSMGRGRGVVCRTRARHVMEVKEKPATRTVSQPLQPSGSKAKRSSDESSGLSASDSDDSSSSDSRKASSDSESKTSSNDSSSESSRSSLSTSSSSAESGSESNKSGSKSQHSGLTESELLSDTHSSYSSSSSEEEKDKKPADNLERLQRQMRRLEMNSNALPQVQVRKDDKVEDIGSKAAARPKEPAASSSSESDAGFSRYMSVFHERWKKEGPGAKAACVHAHRATIASSLKMAQRQSTSAHGTDCKLEPVSAAALFNKRQQILYEDPGTFSCDHADKHDSNMMLQAICDDIQSNKMMHNLLDKQVRKAKISGPARDKPNRFKNPKC